MAFFQKGIKNVLQKSPHDVVFLSALRTPVTRAKKGGLRDAYDHELLGAVRYTLCLLERCAVTNDARSSKPPSPNFRPSIRPR